MSHAPGGRLQDVAGKGGSGPSSAMSKWRLSWPWFPRSITLRSVAVLWPRRLGMGCRLLRPAQRPLRHRWWNTWIQLPLYQLLWLITLRLHLPSPMQRLLQWLISLRPHLPSPLQRQLQWLITLRPHLPSPVQRQLQCSSTWRPLLCSGSHQHLLVLSLRPANSYVMVTPHFS